MALKPSLDKQTMQSVQAGAVRPLYAYVGVTNLAVEAVREALADIQARARDLGKDAQKSWSERDLAAALDPKALREQGLKTLSDLDPKALRAAADKAVVTVAAEAKAAPAKVQRLVESNLATVTEAYDELVARGEGVVKRIRDQRSTEEVVRDDRITAPKAQTTTTTTTTATEAATSAVADEKVVAKRAPAKRAPARRAPAKKTAAKKAPAKKAPAKKAPARRAPAKKAGPAEIGD